MFQVALFVFEYLFLLCRHNSRNKYFYLLDLRIVVTKHILKVVCVIKNKIKG